MIKEGSAIIFLDVLSTPAIGGVLTTVASIFILRYIKVFGRVVREGSMKYVLLFSILNGAVMGLMLVEASSITPRMIIMLVLLATVLALQNKWLSGTSVGASVMLGSAILQNYMTLYFISCAIFRLCPTDNYFRTTGSYRMFIFSLCSIVCTAAVFVLTKWFPNEELKISLYSKSYSPLMRVWLPVSNVLMAISTFIAMPLVPLHNISRTLEVAFFVTLLPWMLSNIAASYLIALVQCRRVRQNERANTANMTLRAMRKDFMLTYLINISTDEFMSGRELFHMDGRYYSEMRRRFVKECIHPEDAEVLLENISNPNYYELRLINSPCYELELRLSKHGLLDLMVLSEDMAQEIAKKHEDYFWTQAQCVVTQSVWGEILLNVGIKDINEAKQQEQKLQREAKTNPLTGLMNRREWKRCVREKLANGSHGMLAVIDLDHFKDVNDNLGHQTGDTVLKETAEIISTSFRVDDLIGHIGGDEFCVFAESLSDRKSLEDKMENLLQRRRKSYIGKDGKRKTLSFSVGIALTPEHGDSLEDLLSYADSALYDAKESGRDSYRVFAQ